MNLHDYAGVIHFHSHYSYDGRIPVSTIVDAARVNTVDFLMLTDHSTMLARTDGFEGWNKGVLLIVGEEIAPRFNHYLAFGHKQAVDCAEKEPDLPPQTYIDRVNALGGFGFIAHPDHAGTKLFHVKHYPWLEWSVSGYTGLGIWDFMTDWQNSLTGYLRSILSYALPAFFMRGPCSATLARWDTLTKERPVVGIGELDNHDTPQDLWGITVAIFPFSRVFNLIRTHIITDRPLTGNSDDDIRSVLTSLQKGRCYVSLDYFHPATGFSMIIGDSNTQATLGERFSLRDTAELHASIPRRGRIRLIRNGSVAQETIGQSLSYRVREAGVYRIEAYLKTWGRFRPWIFSNPVYVDDFLPSSQG
jgi:hypothetical protein